MKRIVVASDFHCGNRAGLTPPAYQDSLETGPVAFRKFAKFQHEVWNFYASELAALQPVDYYFFIGDAVDGKNERSGGTELINTDRIVQAEMATACIKEAHAREVYMVFGTPYHCGVDEDWESVVAQNLKATISGREFIEVEGVMFDLAHYVSGSQVPHGPFTPLARDLIWNILWARDEGQPDADFIVRAHVHYSIYLEMFGKAAMICPALQGYGSKYGVRRCRGKVDIGFVSLDVEDGKVTRCPHVFKSDLLQIEPRRPL